MTQSSPSSPARSFSLELRASPRTVGADFRIAVPMLELTLRNLGEAPIQVPAEGLPMLLSIRLRLERDGRTDQRGAGLGDPAQIRMRSLPPGGETTVRFSPLGDGPRDVPLAAGTYRATVCVREAAEVAGGSPFAAAHGGLCSNTIDLHVTAAAGP